MGGRQASVAGTAPVATQTVKDELDGEHHAVVPRNRDWAPTAE